MAVAMVSSDAQLGMNSFLISLRQNVFPYGCRTPLATRSFLQFLDIELPLNSWQLAFPQPAREGEIPGKVF